MEIATTTVLTLAVGLATIPVAVAVAIASVATIATIVAVAVAAAVVVATFVVDKTCLALLTVAVPIAARPGILAPHVMVILVWMIA
jgi:hypothetical protein